MATSEQESAKKSSTVSESNKDQEPSKYLIPVLALIKVYQFIVSPLLGNNCRFYPSCSSYTIQALEKHGLLKGTLLSIKRISKCHPWHPGGIDEVPQEYKPCCKSQHH